MKAVILAGGSGTRLHPLTLVTNKHLLPVFNKPVIYYAIEKLVAAGIRKIMIVTSPNHIDSFVRLLGSGQHFVPTTTTTARQIQIVYGIQNEPNGIAYGLHIAEDYIGDDNCVLFLGDNIFMDDISSAIEKFKKGATVFLKKVSDPKHFGIAEVRKGKIVSLEEKPLKPKSNLAVTGLYIYDNSVFDKIRRIPPSERGEYEITSVNSLYLEEGSLHGQMLKKEWFDIGNIEALHKASLFMKKNTIM